MNYKIKISPVTKRNIEDAISFYKSEVSVKVARNFIKDYEETLNKIAKNPFYKIYYKNFRGIPLKKISLHYIFQSKRG